MAELNNKMRYPIEVDSEGMAKVIDEDLAGQKAIPVVFVAKESDGKFRHSNDPDESKSINNKMKRDIEEDSRGKKAIVDEDIDGTKAIPFVLVKKDDSGKFVYTKFAESADLSNYYTKSQADSRFIDSTELTNSLGSYYTKAEVDASLSAKANTSDVYTKSEVDSQLSSKLTASQAETQADSVAEDVATLVSDFNALLAKLKSAGIMADSQ